MKIRSAFTLLIATALIFVATGCGKKCPEGFEDINGDCIWTAGGAQQIVLPPTTLPQCSDNPTTGLPPCPTPPPACNPTADPSCGGQCTTPANLPGNDTCQKDTDCCDAKKGLNVCQQLANGQWQAVNHTAGYCGVVVVSPYYQFRECSWRNVKFTDCTKGCWMAGNIATCF